MYLFNKGLKLFEESDWDIHFKLKYHKISCVQSLYLSWRILVKNFIEHSNHTAVLCAQFPKDLSTKMDLRGERDFATFQFKLDFGLL